MRTQHNASFALRVRYTWPNRPHSIELEIISDLPRLVKGWRNGSMTRRNVLVTNRITFYRNFVIQITRERRRGALISFRMAILMNETRPTHLFGQVSMKQTLNVKSS